MNSARTDSADPPDISAQPSVAAPGRRSIAPGVADVLFLVLLVGIIGRSCGSMLDDPGLGWHLRNIDAMWAEGGWLTVDSFTEPRAGTAWRSNQWLGDLALWIGWRWGGLEGIAAVTTIALALTFRLMFRMMTADGVPWPLAATWTYLAALGTSASWVARPNIATIFFVLLTAWTLDRYHRGACSQRRSWWLVPMLAVWTNTHGGFVAGLAMIVAALGVELALSMRIPHGRDRAGARRRAVHLSGLAAAAFAATLVNPYGLDIYPWVLKLLGNTFFMRLNAEWHSPDFHALGAFRFELLILLFPLVIALSRRKVSLVALGLSIFWLHMALGGERYVPLWVVVATPMLARQSVGIAWLVRLPRRLGMSRSLRRLIAMPAPPTRMTYAVLMVSALLIWSRWTQGYSYHDAKNLPTAALRHVIQRHGDRTVFHHHDWGGWLTWHGWPQMKNWIDDRAEVQGEEHLRDYLNVMAARDGWQEIMAAGGVSAVCIPPDAPLADRLATDPAWRQTYRDAHAVVFESARPAAGNLAEQ